MIVNITEKEVSKPNEEKVTPKPKEEKEASKPQ